jgi:hypothetical protein
VVYPPFGILYRAQDLNNVVARIAGYAGCKPLCTDRLCPTDLAIGTRKWWKGQVGDCHAISGCGIGLLGLLLRDEAAAALGARQPALLALPLASEAVDMMVLHVTAGVSDALIHAATMPDET